MARNPILFDFLEDTRTEPQTLNKDFSFQIYRINSP